MPIAVRYGLLAAAVLVSALLSLAIGPRSDVDLFNVLQLLVVDDGSLAHSAVVDLRLPRMLVAGLVGVNLGLAGLALQAVTRNSLASETVLGINQGAALAVALVLVVPAFAGFDIHIAAIIGAVAAGAVAFAIAGGLGGRLDSIRLILAGVTVGAFSFALVRFTFTLEDNLSRIVLTWTAADISSVRLDQALPLALWAGLGLIGSLALSHSYNVLALGDGASHGLGMDPRRVRFFGALLGAVLAGASVAVAGPVSFVGLVVPHVCRLWFGHNHRLLVPAVALGGAGLMLAADVVSKLVRFPYETPVGVICALIGAPYFLFATLRAEADGMSMILASAPDVRLRGMAIVGGLVLLVVAAAAWSLSVGAVPIRLDVIVNTLFGLDGEKQTYILMKSRLPRIVLAMLTGGAMALSGAIIQGVIRNPLASPNIIGINAGAALFALLAVMVLPGLGAEWMPVAAGLGGLVAAAVVMGVAHFRRLPPIHLALIGVAVGFVFEAGVDYLLVTSSDSESSAPLIWLTGSLWGRTWSHVDAVWLPLVVLAGLALLLSYRLDLMALGEEAATGLGLRVPRQRLLLLTVATLLASLSTAVVGVMGFIGLMAPHIARRLVGGGHRLMLPVAALVGMLLVVLADGVGRAIAPPIEVSAGILSALIGAPFFIFIMLTQAEESEP